MVAKYIAVIIAGMAAGWLAHALSVRLIKSRAASSITKHTMTGGVWTAAWIIASGALWFAAVWVYGVSATAFQYIAAFSICAMVSAVDINVRKIPNVLLAALACAALAATVFQKTGVGVGDRFIGLLLCTGIFMAAYLIGRQVGAGDIKYAAAIGFYLGFYYSAMALAIASAALLVYTLYLYASKKGGMKSTVAFGPYMSAGFLTTLVLMGGKI